MIAITSITKLKHILHGDPFFDVLVFLYTLVFLSLHNVHLQVH